MIRPLMAHARILSIALSALSLLALLGRPATATPYANLATVDNLAIRPYPRARLQVVNPANSANIGPQISSFTIDTGSPFVTVVGDAVNQLTAGGYQTVATYLAPGAAGPVQTRVSQPYRLDVTGSTGTVLPIDNIRMLSASDAESAASLSRLGMPALVGRSTTIDLLGSFDPRTSWQVVFNNQSFGAAANRYHLPIELVNIPLTGQQSPTDPLPTAAPLPVIDAKLRYHGRSQLGRFIVDTTKELSSISPEFALAMGFDTNGNGSIEDEADSNLGHLDVPMLGGNYSMPLLEGDAIKLVTSENVDLIWSGAAFGVLDTPDGIDGIIGWDLFTSGWSDRVSEFPDADNGYIYKMHFDLNNAASGAGQLVLDVNPYFNQVISPPDYQNVDLRLDINADGHVEPLDVLVLINYINDNTNGILPDAVPGADFPPPYLDPSGDDIASAIDVLQVINFLNAQSNGFLAPAGLTTLSPQGLTQAVPEPTSAALLSIAGLFGLGLLALRRTARRIR
jgi:hypothetical protein